jgi:hypothetical protein
MADFLATGAVDLFFQFRKVPNGADQPYLYLGSAVTAPEIEAVRYYTPVNSDLNSPAPFQQIFNSEQHNVIVTLNRLNYPNWDLLKFGQSTPTSVRSWVGGRLELNSGDFYLILRYFLPCNSPQPFPVDPSGTSSYIVRQYVSALLTDYRESTVRSRVNEVSLVFQCNPLYNYLVIPGNPSPQFTLYEEYPAVGVPTPQQLNALNQ